MKVGHVPMRMCVICRRSAAKHELLRYVRFPQALSEQAIPEQVQPEKAVQSGDGFKVDEGQTCPGRGWYVCTETACREKFRQYRAGGRKRKGVSA